MLAFSYALLVTIIQLAGAYIRYLPFSQIMERKEAATLWRNMLIWSVFGLLINFSVTYSLGITMATYKLLFFFGMTPYLVISVIHIPHRLPQHLFVLGIQALYAFMLHSSSGIILTLIYSNMTAILLPLQLTLWIFLFLLIYPWGQKLFTSLLPDEQFVSDTRLRWYIAFLPISFYVGCLISISNVTFLPELSSRLSRFSIPLFFFIFYSIVHYNSDEEQQHKKLKKNKERLTKQRESLKEHTKLMQENEKALSVLRHDMRHSYRLIYALLEKGDYDSIRNHIAAQKALLENTSENAK